MRGRRRGGMLLTYVTAECRFGASCSEACAQDGLTEPRTIWRRSPAASLAEVQRRVPFRYPQGISSSISQFLLRSVFAIIAQAPGAGKISLLQATRKSTLSVHGGPSHSRSLPAPHLRRPSLPSLSARLHAEALPAAARLLRVRVRKREAAADELVAVVELQPVQKHERLWVDHAADRALHTRGARRRGRSGARTETSTQRPRARWRQTCS